MDFVYDFIDKLGWMVITVVIVFLAGGVISWLVNQSQGDFAILAIPALVIVIIIMLWVCVWFWTSIIF